MALRQTLHGAGLRYRVDRAVIPGSGRRADIVFGPAKVAVFVDGCFWHRCPRHGTLPLANNEWWLAKLDRNSLRDAETDTLLLEHGWLPLHVWEHEAPREAAARVREQVMLRGSNRVVKDVVSWGQ